MGTSPGLSLDSNPSYSGLITGTLTQTGTYPTVFYAINSLGAGAQGPIINITFIIS